MWCQQLISESLGKKESWDTSGIIPRTKGSSQSLTTRFFDGPRDKIFYIISLKKEENKKPNKNIFNEKISFSKTKSFNQIKNAQKEALIKTLRLKKIPYKEFL